MPARMNPAYMQHSTAPTTRMIAYVNPAFFQPGALHENFSAVHGRKSRAGTTKGRKAGVHGRGYHGSPMLTVHDPWKHKGMGRNKR